MPNNPYVSLDSAASESATERVGDRVARLAAMVARGETPLPTGLPANELADLLERVHRLRRDWLITYIARAIAHDIADALGPRHGGCEHAEKQL